MELNGNWMNFHPSSLKYFYPISDWMEKLYFDGNCFHQKFMDGRNWMEFHPVDGNTWTILDGIGLSLFSGWKTELSCEDPCTMKYILLGQGSIHILMNETGIYPLT